MKPQGFQKLTPTETALKTWFEQLKLAKPSSVTVELNDALGRILVKDLVAVESLPRFDKSAMDGYAIKAEDLAGASEDAPVTLQLTTKKELKAGQAREIWTGNPIPAGADSVVMIEDTRKGDAGIEVCVELTRGKNVSIIGEDIVKGAVIAKGGTRLNPYHLGLAAAMGYTKLEVAAKPKIGLVGTGNEVAQTG